MVDDGEGIDQGGAEEGIHILWHILALTWSVLGPVGEVALHARGISCVGSEQSFKRVLIVESAT